MTANAQDAFLDGLRKIENGRGKIVVMQNPDIDRLVNGAVPAKQTTQTTHSSGSQQTSQKPAATANNNSETSKPDASAKVNSSTSASTTEEDTQVVDTRKKVMRNSYKTTGYRIQVFSGGNSRADRQKAEAAGNAMKSSFPYEPVYVHFYSPSWKCRMGNYKELSEAQQVLRDVKALGYKNACIVKGTINVQY